MLPEIGNNLAIYIGMRIMESAALLFQDSVATQRGPKMFSMYFVNPTHIEEGGLARENIKIIGHNALGNAFYTGIVKNDTLFNERFSQVHSTN